MKSDKKIIEKNREVVEFVDSYIASIYNKKWNRINLKWKAEFIKSLLQ
jgi:hypothetical protein